MAKEGEQEQESKAGGAINKMEDIRLEKKDDGQSLNKITITFDLSSTAQEFFNGAENSVSRRGGKLNLKEALYWFETEGNKVHIDFSHPESYNSYDVLSNFVTEKIGDIFTKSDDNEYQFKTQAEIDQVLSLDKVQQSCEKSINEEIEKIKNVIGDPTKSKKVVEETVGKGIEAINKGYGRVLDLGNSENNPNINDKLNKKKEALLKHAVQCRNKTAAKIIAADLGRGLTAGQKLKTSLPTRNVSNKQGGMSL